MNTATALLSILASLISAGGLGTIITARVLRRKAPADIVATLSQATINQVAAAMQQVDQLQERVHEAETAARHAREESDQAWAQLRSLKRAFNELIDRVDRTARMIHDPYITIDVLRQLVPNPGPSLNSDEASKWTDR